MGSEETKDADSPRIPRPSTMEGVIVRRTMAAMLFRHAGIEALKEAQR